MSEVADLFASLGLRVNLTEWTKGDAAMRKARSALDDLDRAADKFASSQKVAKARERDAARAAAATKAQAREEARAAVLAERAQRKAIAAVSLDRTRADRAAKQQAEKAAAERKRMIQRTESQAQMATMVIGGLGLYLGQRAVRAGIQFNSTMEDSKNEVAGMLALAHKSSLTQELKTADVLVDNLRERASKLPGTTMEYVQMLSMITQPLTDAKLGLKDLEDMTVSAVIASKGLHVAWQVAARDVDQAIRGQYHSVDPFSGKVLGSIGYKGEEGRSRYNALTQEKRASEYRRGLAQPQFAQLGEAAGKSFSGVLSTLQDAWEHFTGMVTRPLFETLTAKIKELNEWLEHNEKTVKEYAKAIGEDLLAAFSGLVAVFQFLIEHGDMVMAILIGIGTLMAAMAVKSIIALWPLYAIAAVLGLIAYGVIKLIKHWDAVKDAAKRAWEAIKDGFSAAFEWVMSSAPVRALLAVIRAAERLTQIGPKKSVEAGTSWLGNAGRALVTGQNPLFNLSGSGSGARTSSVTVGKVDVNVNSPNADPNAVASAVGKHFDEKMGNMLRQSMDVVAP